MQLRGWICRFAAMRLGDGYKAYGFVVSGGSAPSSGIVAFTPYVGRHRVFVSWFLHTICH